MRNDFDFHLNCAIGSLQNLITDQSWETMEDDDDAAITKLMQMLRQVSSLRLKFPFSETAAATQTHKTPKRPSWEDN
jgi:hypothetical protein